ncbi:hypothetical protein [Mycoplana sp. MJR14]|uniref:hypothetical protein n=1 Tax=Mycoplana sp. MJR14 TaxID=3032583 RepID=UPI0023DABDDC|nr:hypothetical protein [Mycoplana sp. MJR14]MDF1631208.1 hypothetical protein [Mycoplana sp. MJR14]
MEPSLIVMNATGAKLQAGKLILDGAAPNAIILADRPVPAAGHALTAHLLEQRDEGSDSSLKNQPNAVVATFAKDGPSVKDEVVMLRSPTPPTVASTSMSLYSKAKFRLMRTGRPLSSSTSLSCHVRRCPLRAPPDPNYLPLLPY